MFASSSNWTASKRLVRMQVDAPLLAMLTTEEERLLSYFGLPEEGEDINAWHQYIGEVTAVDTQAATLRKLVLNMQIYHSNIAVYERLGLIENLILNGEKDLNGEKLWNRWDENAYIWRWAYDLVNLDAYRAFLHERTIIPGRQATYYKRAEAIRKLFERQRGHRFIFLLTVPMKIANRQAFNNFKSDIEAYLIEQERTLNVDESRIIAQRSSERFDYSLTPLLITAVPLLLARYAAEQSFRLSECLTLTYRGNKNAPMLHVACRFEPTGLALPSQPDYNTALRAPYLIVRVDRGTPRLILSEHQSIVSDRNELQQYLAGLGITLDQ